MSYGHDVRNRLRTSETVAKFQASRNAPSTPHSHEVGPEGSDEERPAAVRHVRRYRGASRRCRGSGRRDRAASRDAASASDATIGSRNRTRAPDPAAAGADDSKFDESPARAAGRDAMGSVLHGGGRG